MHKDSHTKPLHDATAQMAVDAQMWQPKRLTRHDAKPTEQARRARMHDSGRTESLHDAATQTTAIRHPATLSPAQQAGYYFWCGGWENPQLAGKAWMSYKMNAQRI